MEYEEKRELMRKARAHLSSQGYSNVPQDDKVVILKAMEMTELQNLLIYLKNSLSLKVYATVDVNENKTILEVSEKTGYKALMGDILVEEREI